MTSPATTVREAAKAIIEEEFAAESLLVKMGKLHESVARDRARVGIYPELEEESERTIDQSTVIVIQVFRKWVAEAEPEKVVDPAPLEQWAHRLRKAFFEDQSTGTGRDAWFYRIQKIEYGEDPTGQITRFTARVKAWGENAAVIETQA